MNKSLKFLLGICFLIMFFQMCLNLLLVLVALSTSNKMALIPSLGEMRDLVLL